MNLGYQRYLLHGLRDQGLSRILAPGMLTDSMLRAQRPYSPHFRRHWRGALGGLQRNSGILTIDKSVGYLVMWRYMAKRTLRAGTKSLDRRTRWKVLRFRSGACICCGLPRAESVYLRHCKACGEGLKKRRRAKTGRKAWVKGAPGRPPLRVTNG
jgi:hypothetical protein